MRYFIHKIKHEIISRPENKASTLNPGEWYLLSTAIQIWDNTDPENPIWLLPRKEFIEGVTTAGEDTINNATFTIVNGITEKSEEDKQLILDAEEYEAQSIKQKYKEYYIIVDKDYVQATYPNLVQEVLTKAAAESKPIILDVVETEDESGNPVNISHVYADRIATDALAVIENDPLNPDFGTPEFENQFTIHKLSDKTTW